MSQVQDELAQMGTLDCAIIGGGVSGLYTGWRLLQDKPGMSVGIFEMSKVTGGRLLTWLPYGQGSGLRAELGGMRFFSQQQLVWNLIQHLGLEVVQFYVTGPNLTWYLRGHRMGLGDADAAALRYSLNQGERGKSPGEVLQHVIATLLGSPENRRVIEKHLGGRQPQTREDWDAIKPYLTYKGDPLWNLGFWNILGDIISYEGYQYVTDAFGYYSFTTNWNAAEAMQTIFLDFAQNPDYKTLAEGYGHLPDTLRDAFTARGGRLFLGHRLISFEVDSDGAFLLQFSQGVARARRLVLAMPARSLELLEPSRAFDPRTNRALRAMIQSVKAYHAFKLFLLYEERWWEKVRGIEHGRSICDLPIRQTYYFRPDACERDAIGAGPGYGLLMASYNDTRSVDYWQGLELPRPERVQAREALRHTLAGLAARTLGSREPSQPMFFSGAPGAESYDPPPPLHQATEAMLTHATEQLALLHGMNVEDVPKPLIGAYADWSLDPYGGGWNLWRPQVNVQEVMEGIKKPLGDEQEVYIVGEAYSGEQGWVEGALTTTELVLQKGFGLKRPSWLPEDYYLGW